MVGATLKKQNGIYLLYIGDDLVLRFKKIGKDGRCHNIPTRQQNRFEAQRNLPSMEKGTMLHAGYMLDELGQRIVAIRIVCQFARQVIWQIDLSEGGTENVVAMPSQPSMPIKPKSPRFERDTKETPAEPKVENSGKE
ncbi:MAG TPA: hypothetical protein VJN69_10095 [Candidatus Acidoferrales bacterium]|nr:hypothetical protein [Candidatus Acidoferrales bacterium]